MIKVQIAKMFHRDTVAMRAGESFTETMRFVDFDAATEWGRAINEKHAELPYHITGVFETDEQGRYAASFCCYDISEIWDTYEVRGREVYPYWTPEAKLVNKNLAELLKTLFYANARGDVSYREQVRDQVESLLADAAVLKAA